MHFFAPSTYRFIFIIFLFVALGSSASLAKGKGGQGGGRSATPPPVPDPRILVTAVDVAKQQITIVFKKTGQTHVYGVDGMTTVTIENNPGTINDIKVGQQVFSYTERDDVSLDTITVGKADPPPVQPAKKSTRSSPTNTQNQ